MTALVPADGVVATAARALLRSGMLSPPSPAAALRLIAEVRRGGTNPYTLLAVAAVRWPNRSAIIDGDGVMSYRELQSETESLAGELLLWRDGLVLEVFDARSATFKEIRDAADQHLGEVVNA